jgi:hypothetical protein
VFAALVGIDSLSQTDTYGEITADHLGRIYSSNFINSSVNGGLVLRLANLI